MCRETLGATPVYRCTCAASWIFSNGSRGTPGCPNTLKRVPELPNPHDGVSIRWRRRASLTAVNSGMEGFLGVARAVQAGELVLEVEDLGDEAKVVVGVTAVEVDEELRH